MHDSTHTCIYIYIHTHIVSSWLSLLIEASACITAKLTRLLDRGARSGQVVHPHVQRRRPLHWQKDVFRGLAGVVAPRLGANSFQWCP